MTCRIPIAIFSLLILGFSGCKDKTPKPPLATSQAPLVSPAANPTPAKVAIPKAPASNDPDWRKGTAKVADAGAKAATPTVGKKVDAGKAAAELAQAKKDTEAAVDKAMAGINAKLKACFDAAKVASVTVTARFKVRQSGYVTDATVTGAPGALKGCVETAINAAKVSGASAAVTISRTFNYKKK